MQLVKSVLDEIKKDIEEMELKIKEQAQDIADGHALDVQATCTRILELQSRVDQGKRIISRLNCAIDLTERPL